MRRGAHLHQILASRTFHTNRSQTKTTPKPPPSDPTAGSASSPARRKPFSPRTKAVAAIGGLSLAVAIGLDGYHSGFQRTGGAVRFGRSVCIAATISLDYSWSTWGLERLDEATQRVRMSAINQRSADRLLAGCLANGGLYVKIGQGISAINHILPLEYTETLRKLENECLPRDTSEVRALFQLEFGRSPDQMFATFDYKPVAAASLAQVFKARTHSGDEVAVKVQYADLADRFAGDFGTIQLLQSAVKCMHSGYNFSWILDEVRGNLEQEMDFVREGRNGQRCSAEMDDRFGSKVHVPEVHWDLTSKRVLTAEWIEGYKVSDTERIREDGLKLRDVDAKLFDAFAEQIFGTGFVHADPHPGNVLVRKNDDGKAQIVLLDHGLYEDLPANVRISLCLFWEAIVLRDEPAMKKYAAELGVDDYNNLAEILLQRPFTLGPSYANAPRSLSFRLTDAELAYMQEMAAKRFETVLITLRQMPKTMLFVVRNLNTIRAIARLHGDPLDRPKHMARYAQRCLFRTHRDGGRFAAFRWAWRRLRFEYQLLKVSLVVWLIRTWVMTRARLAGRGDEMVTILDGSSAGAPKVDVSMS